MKFKISLKITVLFMVNFGYTYNDLVICKDSTDYLANPSNPPLYPPISINEDTLTKSVQNFSELLKVKGGISQFIS